MNSSESHLKYSTGGTEFGFTTFVKYLLFLRQPFTNTVLFGKFCQQKFRGFVGVFFVVFFFFYVIWLRVNSSVSLANTLGITTEKVLAQLGQTLHTPPKSTHHYL